MNDLNPRSAAPVDEKMAGMTSTQLDTLWHRVNREVSRRSLAVLETANAVQDQRREERRAELMRKAAEAALRPKTASPWSIGDELFRSPDDSMLVWRGRGRRPKWLTAVLARRHVTLDSLKSTWTETDARNEETL